MKDITYASVAVLNQKLTCEFIHSNSFGSFQNTPRFQHSLSFLFVFKTNTERGEMVRIYLRIDMSPFRLKCHIKDDGNVILCDFVSYNYSLSIYVYAPDLIIILNQKLILQQFLVS